MSKAKPTPAPRKTAQRPYVVLHRRTGAKRLIEAANAPRIAAHLARSTWVIKAATGLEVAEAVRAGIEIENLPEKDMPAKRQRPLAAPDPGPAPAAEVAPDAPAAEPGPYSSAPVEDGREPVSSVGHEPSDATAPQDDDEPVPRYSVSDEARAGDILAIDERPDPDANWDGGAS